MTVDNKVLRTHRDLLLTQVHILHKRCVKLGIDCKELDGTVVLLLESHWTLHHGNKVLKDHADNRVALLTDRAKDIVSLRIETIRRATELQTERERSTEKGAGELKIVLELKNVAF